MRLKVGTDPYGFGIIVSWTDTTHVKIDVLSTFTTATTNTAKWSLGLYSATDGFPSNSMFYEERHNFAGSDNRPNRWDGSASGDFETFTPGVEDADAAFDREWALTVLSRSMEALRLEQATEGKGETFERLQPWLSGEAAHGDQAALAESLGMNVNTLKAVTHRLRQRFRTLVRAEIAATLEDESAVDEEMQVLFAALRNR